MRAPLLLLLVAACPTATTEATKASPVTPTAAPTASAAQSGAAERGPTPPLPTEAMIQQMIAQLVLDHPRVSPFLHVEIAANVPLAVFPSPDLSQGADKLTAGGRPVRVVAAEGDARLIFRGRESIGPARERLRFAIPAEGVSGHVDVELADNVWRAVDASVAER